MYQPDRSHSRFSSVAARTLYIVLCLALSWTAAEATPEDAAVRRVALQLQCPVCEGQTVADSSSGLARDMRSTIRSKQAGGEGDQQVLDEFVAAYGDGILTEPPKRGIGLGVWVGPVAALALGALVLARLLRHWRRSDSVTQPVALDPVVAGELRHFREELW
jgi:cytochrome c-type biogenesis protein CcmH